MKRPLLALLLLTASLAGCIGGEETPAEPATAPTGGPSNGSIETSDPLVAVEECLSGFSGVPCFEASVAVGPQGRIFVADSVCTGIARSANATSSFETLDLPDLPPTAPPTTTNPGDCTLDVGPQGDLYFSAFYFHREPSESLPDHYPTHYGIQVARSEDGGDSWVTNTYLSATSLPPTPSTHPDRQWLSFGSDGRVYLTFWGYEGEPGPPDSRSWIAVSEDRAASFGPFEQMDPVFTGQPVAQGNGTLHVPWLDRNADAVQISTSTDGGETFETRTVADVDSQYWWPDLAEGPSGRLYVTWIDGDGRVLVAREAADDGWSKPVVWNAGTQNATGVTPGLAVHDGFVDVVWYANQGDQRAHVLGRAPIGAFNASSVSTHVLGTYEAERTVSHFADMAVDPQGQGVFAWTDPDRGLLVAGELDPGQTNATAAEGTSR